MTKGTKPMSFTGQDVEAARKRLGLSRQKFAELTGLTSAKVSNIEKGREMRPEEVVALTPHVRPGEGAGTPQDGTSPLPPAPTGVPDVVALGEDELEDPVVDPTDIVSHGYDPNDPSGCTCVCGHQAGSPNKLGSHIGTPQQTSGVPTPEATGATPDAGAGAGAGADDVPPPPAEDVVESVAPVTPDPTFEIPDGVYAVSNSELRTFKRCRRKWYIAYYRQLGLPEPEFIGVRSIGTRVHKALEAYYVPAGTEAVDPRVALEKVLAEDREMLLESQPMQDQLDEFDKQADLCRAMVEGYVEWLAETGIDQFIEVVAPESRVLVPIDVQGPQGEKVALLGKLDIRVRRTTDDARLFVDHKTVGNLTQPTKTLHMDEQMMHYHLLEWLDMIASGNPDGVRTDGGLYNMLRKVKRTANAKPPFFDRIEVRHSITVLRAYYVRVVGEILDMLELKRRLDTGMDVNQVAYPNPMSQCTWDCDFFHLCSMFDDGSRVEDYMAANLVTINPHKRYEDSLDREEQ